MVYSGVCRGVCLGIGLRISAGRVALRTGGGGLEGDHLQSVRGRGWSRQRFFWDLNPAVQIMFHGGGTEFSVGMNWSLVVARAGLAGAFRDEGNEGSAIASAGPSVGLAPPMERLRVTR